MGPAVLLLCVLGLSTSQAFLFGSNDGKWDNLRTTWGVSALSSTYYVAKPRTVKDAVNAGWTADNTVKCGAPGSYAGNRYIKDGDTSIMLLYDINGIIAGIQNGIPKNMKSGYPQPNTYKVWVEEPSMWVATAYFVNPATICSTGRSQRQFDVEGTGTGLWIQNGPTPNDLVSVPTSQSDMAGTVWTEGNCFFTMGKHYWYALQKNMDCNKTFPVFLLFNGGKLNGFGWAMTADVPGSHYEKPPPVTFGQFMKEVPDCFNHVEGGVTTMHIFLTDSVRTSNFC